MPTSNDIATYGWGMQVAGAVSSAVGAYESIASQKQQLRMRAVLDDLNAQQAERTARSTLEAGTREMQRSELATASLKGTQQAQFGANGVDMSTGSAARVLTTTDVMGEVDKNTIAANAVRAAWGYRTQGVNSTNQGLFDRSSASALNPFTGATSSLMGSAGSVASEWYMLNRAGAFTTPGSGVPVNPQMGP